MAKDRNNAEQAFENKRQLQRLAMACIFYLNCKNITLERIEADKKVNAKRAKHGKRLLPDYYTCRVVKTHYEPQGAPTEGEEARKGSKHSFMYDVRGFFRKVSGGTIWINTHKRGLANALYKPKVYKVAKEPSADENN